MKEYLVRTKCGRKLGWWTSSYESLFRELDQRGYQATFVEPMEDYEKRERENNVQTV